MRLTTSRTAFLLAAVLLARPLAAAEWPGFRGPAGAGRSDAASLPLAWNDGQRVLWRQPLPGRGSSSPVFFGNRLFVTCYDGYGQSKEEPGDIENLRRLLLCFDRETGELLWTAEEPDNTCAGAFAGFVRLHGYASSTPVTDGKTVYVFYGCSGVFAYGLNGTRLWHADVGVRNDAFGSGASPLLFDDLLIVNASIEDRALVAFDRKTGAERWRTGGINRAWSTPAIVTTAAGNPELVVSMKHEFKGYDPMTGKERWVCDGVNGYVCPSAVSHGDIVYAIGGRRGMAVAIRTGGQGDITESRRLWVQKAGSNVSSPVYHEGHLYWISDTGIAFVLDASTGEIVTRRRMPDAAPMYASMTYGDGKLYAVSRENGTFVLGAEPTLPQLAHNVFSEDDSDFNGSPALSDGRIYLRSNRYLYCIGESRPHHSN